jgi:hypothetical protein
VWLPVEITAPRGGFLNAVQVGAREWQTAVNADPAASQGQLFPMYESWGVYRSVSVPGAGDRLPAMPDESEIVRAFEKEMEKWR